MVVTCRAAGREGNRSGLRRMALPRMTTLLLESARAGLAAAIAAGLNCTADAIAAAQLPERLMHGSERKCAMLQSERTPHCHPRPLIWMGRQLRTEARVCCQARK